MRKTTISSKVLCVDDDSYLTDLLRFGLSREGFVVEVASSATEALRAVAIDPPDIVLTEIDLRDMDGKVLCSRLSATARVPVVLLTTRMSEDDIIAGLAVGADDYVTKPFSIRVLARRLQAVLRRYRACETHLAVSHRTYLVGDSEFSPERNQLSRGACTVKLTRTESEVLHLLVMNKWHVLSVEHIMEQLWGYDAETSGSVIKTHVCNLRTKLAKLCGPGQLIHTVPGIGYTYYGSSAVTVESPA
jgi:DNA-binding response OmpR family regulator